MNENIKQLIEKECEAQKDIHWNDFGERADSASRLFDEAFAKGFNSCLSKWQEAERWRKVEEELPEDGDLVLAKWEALDPEHTEIKVLSYSVELGFTTADELGDCDDNVTHWKPIND